MESFRVSDIDRPEPPYLAAWISAMMETAISAGLSPPMSRPMGAWTCFSVSSE